ncbi:MAG: hypothetical protein QOI15_615 [Pseudonocardiales bacterium]|nr:hypothetical protein [Pseudonocardiales bacterium]
MRAAGRLVAVSTLVAGVLSAVSTPAGAATAAPAWLARVNAIRIAAGLSGVTESPAWDAGLDHHLTYLEKTDPSLLTGQYASAHTENPASPYYTSDGAAEGGSSDLAYGTSSNLDAINRWLAAPFHAIGMLRPGLEQVAFFRHARSGDAGLDVLSGLTGFGIPPAAPILFPGNGATTDFVAFGGESPSPVETCHAEHPHADYSQAGLPIIAMLPDDPAVGLGATLSLAGGGTVSTGGPNLCVVDPNTYTSTDPVYGPTGAAILAGDRAVLLIPRTPLVNGTYSVDIAQPSQPDISWSFTLSAALVPQNAPSIYRFGAPLRVGTVLQAEPGFWDAGGSHIYFPDMQFAYRWYAGGAPISGATALTYTLGPADVGKRISVRVTATEPGYTTGSASSQRTALVQPGVLTCVSRPQIVGTPKVGRRLRADSGYWQPVTPTTFHYRWFADGEPIPNATHRSFVLTRSQRGERVAVHVRASTAGYQPKTARSVATGPVTRR